MMEPGICKCFMYISCQEVFAECYRWAMDLVVNVADILNGNEDHGAKNGYILSSW